MNSVKIKVDKIRSYQTLVNKIGRRTYRTKEYNIYEKGIATQLNQLESVKGSYALMIDFIANTRNLGDLDNIVKPISDILEATGKVENDRHCLFLQATKQFNKNLESCYIIVQLIESNLKKE